MTSITLQYTFSREGRETVGLYYIGIGQFHRPELRIFQNYENGRSKAQIGPKFDPPTELKWTQLESTDATCFASWCIHLPLPHSYCLPDITKAVASSQVNLCSMKITCPWTLSYWVIKVTHTSTAIFLLKGSWFHFFLCVCDLISFRAQANVRLGGRLLNRNSITSSISQCRTTTKMN